LRSVWPVNLDSGKRYIMTNNSLFRQSALNRLSSPEQLDQTLTVVKPSGWIVLCVFGVLLGAVIVWGVLGSIPDKVNGQGVLVYSGNLTGITYATGGVVKDVFLESGKEVHTGQIIARIERQDLLEQVEIASHRLSNLLQNYESTERLSGRSSDITDEMLTKIRGDLRQQIASLTTQIADAQRNEKSMKSLYDDGLVTERVYFSARDELLTLQRQKQEAEQRLIDNELNRVKSTGETDQKLLSLQHQIDEARTQLEIQQEAYQSATCIISSVTGTVYEVAISRGAYVAPGSTIAVIEPYKSDGTALQATVFFPAQEGKRIERGMNIAISPSTVKQEEYGYIQGIVMSVSKFPVSTQYLLTSLQNEGLAKMFAELGTPIEVKVSLIPDPTTATGFRWSSSKGPNISLETGILCTGAVTVRKQKPVELIIPLIKKKLLGIGNSQDQKEQGGKSNENKQHR